MHKFWKNTDKAHSFPRMALIASICIPLLGVSLFISNSSHALGSEPPAEKLSESIPSPTETASMEETTVQTETVPETAPFNAAYRLDAIEDPAVFAAVQDAQADYLDFSPSEFVDSYVKELKNEIETDSGKAFSPDESVIPDKRNTGIPEGTVLKPFSASGHLGIISDAEQAAGKMPLYIGINQQGYYNINGYSNTNASGQIIIEGYDFSNSKLYLTNDGQFPSQVMIIFKNCKLHSVQFFGEQVWMIMDHCEVTGNISGNNMIIENCYLDSYNNDALNPVRNVIVKDSYIADLFKEASPNVVHMDGIQIFGDRYGGVSENIVLDNVRLSIPQLGYENSTAYVNSAISLGLEFSEGQNYMFRNIMIDTGGRWNPIYNTSGETVLYKNIQVGSGYNHIFYTNYFNPKATVKDVRLSDGLYVTSVWKDDEEKTHFLCSNNNMRTNKTLKVVTDQQEYTFPIERHPTPQELAQNPVYMSYRFQDLPYDLEFVIDEDIAFAEFFDGAKQIRSVSFE